MRITIEQLEALQQQIETLTEELAQWHELVRGYGVEVAELTRRVERLERAASRPVWLAPGGRA